jgi:hypothetical protein
LESTFNFDFEVLLEESLTENDEDMSVQFSWGIIVSFEVDTGTTLFFAVDWIDDVFGEGLERLWEESSGLISSITSGDTDEDTFWDFGELNQVLDGGWSLEEVLDSLAVLDGFDEVLLSD